jgi:hypothetical protein
MINQKCRQPWAVLYRKNAGLIVKNIDYPDFEWQRGDKVRSFHRTRDEARAFKKRWMNEGPIKIICSDGKYHYAQPWAERQERQRVWREYY